jgi:hypothetical protein
VSDKPRGRKPRRTSRCCFVEPSYGDLELRRSCADADAIGERAASAIAVGGESDDERRVRGVSSGGAVSPVVAGAERLRR